MALTTVREVLGPWSLATSRAFWEGFSPNALRDQDSTAELRATFLVDHDWSLATATVRTDAPGRSDRGPALRRAWLYTECGRRVSRHGRQRSAGYPARPAA